MTARLRSKNERMMLDLLDQIKNLPTDLSSDEFDSLQVILKSKQFVSLVIKTVFIKKLDSSSSDSSDESIMSDGLAALLEIPCAAEDRTVRGRSCKKDEYEWIPRTELDEMKHGSCNIKNNVNQTTEKKNSDIQLEQDNSKNNPMTYAKKIDHCNFINIEKIRSIQVNKP